jgi:SHS2 domain-containing protein
MPEGGFEPDAEHFAHGANIGIRGRGATREAAFERAALALMDAIADRSAVAPSECVELACSAPDDETLLLDWINLVIYEAVVQQMLFSRFVVHIEDHNLRAEAWGEPRDPARHAPAVEPKGATFNELAVTRHIDGVWTAQCVVAV